MVLYLQLFSPQCITPTPIVYTKGLWTGRPNGVRCVLVLSVGSALMKFDLATIMEVLHKSVKKGPYVLCPMQSTLSSSGGLPELICSKSCTMMLWRVFLWVDLVQSGQPGPLGGVGIGRGNRGSKPSRTPKKAQKTTTNWKGCVILR